MAIQARRAMALDHTHILEASATPIPHAVASTFYAGVNIIKLRESPVKRQISSVLQDLREHKTLSRKIKEIIAQQDDGKIAIIYPRVSAESVVSVESAANDLSNALPDLIAKVHGKLTEQQIKAELDAFRSGEKRVLVASSIVETGIDVPDIRLMIVREADRFGAAQLHQLRGRLARNGGEATFVMLVDDMSSVAEDTMRRLHAVKETLDGFDLAEKDMAIRGFGDLLGEQQNGEIGLPMRLVNLSVNQVNEEISAFNDDFEIFGDVLLEQQRDAVPA